MSEAVQKAFKERGRQGLWSHNPALVQLLGLCPLLAVSGTAVNGVTAIDRLMEAYFHDLHRILGLFVPLIVTNCVILGRVEAFASKSSVPIAAWDGLMTGVGFPGCWCYGNDPRNSGPRHSLRGGRSAPWSRLGRVRNNGYP